MYPAVSIATGIILGSLLCACGRGSAGGPVEGGVGRGCSVGYHGGTVPWPCAPGLACAQAKIGTCGICVVAAREGEACSGSFGAELSVPCGSDLYCSSTGRCEKYSAAGESCRSRLCAQGLACDQQNFVCAVPRVVAAGEHCDKWATLCAADSFCDASTAVCKPKKQPGDVCGANNECASFICCSFGPCAGSTFICLAPAPLGGPCELDWWCEPQLRCWKTQPASGPGHCVPRLQQGDACNPTMVEDSCGLGLGCDPNKKTCQPPRTVAVGELCDGASFRCDVLCMFGICHGPPKPGGPCQDAAECPPNYGCALDRTCQPRDVMCP